MALLSLLICCLRVFEGSNKVHSIGGELSWEFFYLFLLV